MKAELAGPADRVMWERNQKCFWIWGGAARKVELPSVGMEKAVGEACGAGEQGEKGAGWRATLWGVGRRSNQLSHQARERGDGLSCGGGLGPFGSLGRRGK